MIMKVTETLMNHGMNVMVIAMISIWYVINVQENYI